MRLLYEENLNGVSESTFALPAPVNLVKVFVSGDLAVQGSDKRLLLNVNGIQNKYKGFVVMNGDADATEFEESGFYIGRSGWNGDAELTAEVTICSKALSNKIISSGLSTFTAPQNRILGYQCNSFVAGVGPIRNITLDVNGGVFSGKVEIFDIG